MLDLVRRNWRFFVIGSVAALVPRFLFLIRFPGVVTDSFVYGDIAKNWLQHGIYGFSGAEISPTYIRLPGYPAFLAFMFAIFGSDHYHAALVVQIFVDLGTCYLCADIALRLLGARGAKIAFLLAALCPFLANYSAAALTETLEVFFTAMALALAVRGLEDPDLRYWAGCGGASAGAILLRPDGALLIVAIEAYVAAKLVFQKQFRPPTQVRLKLQAIFLLAVIAVLPLVPWTLRNWKVFHRFQPLAPRYANEEGEFIPMGFNHWVKTWIADYVSVEEIYWQVPGNAIDAEKLPSRAFDNRAQQKQTLALIEDYNQLLHITPRLDRKFETLATTRTNAHPSRYYVGLPILRIADMWLRPRTEMLPSDSRWWEFNDELKWSALAVAFGAINLFYVLSALAGALQSRGLQWAGLLILFVVLRSAFLATLENPEPRYTLEMYPAVIVFAAAASKKNEAYPKGESVMRNRVRTCSDNSSMA